MLPDSCLLFLLKFVVILFSNLDLARHSKGVSPLPKVRSRIRGKVVDVSHRLGTPMMPKPEWLIATPKDQLPQPERLAFPPTPKDGLFALKNASCSCYNLFYLYFRTEEQRASRGKVSLGRCLAKAINRSKW